MQSEWINVNEKLPEMVKKTFESEGYTYSISESDSVLAWDGFRFHLVVLVGDPYKTYWESADFNGERWELSEMLAWMPLSEPEPYEVKND